MRGRRLRTRKTRSSGKSIASVQKNSSSRRSEWRSGAAIPSFSAQPTLELKTGDTVERTQSCRLLLAGKRGEVGEGGGVGVRGLGVLPPGDGVEEAVGEDAVENGVGDGPRPRHFAQEGQQRLQRPQHFPVVRLPARLNEQTD